MYGSNLDLKIDIDFAKHTCKCNICKKNIYPREIRVKAVILENRYWEDDVDELREIFLHPECLILLLTKAIIDIKTKQLKKEKKKFDAINKILEE